MSDLKARLSNPETREEALQDLKSSGHRTAAAIAAQYTTDRDKFVRLYALECLLERGDRRYAKRVRPLLDDPYDMARVSAIECLAEWGCRGEWRRVARCLDDRSRTVRAYAAWALGRLRASESRGRLERRLARERQDICKAGLLEALYRLTKETEYAARLASVLENSRDYRARAFAANSLVGVLDRSTRDLVVGALQRAVRREKAVGIRRRLRENLEMVTP